MAGLIDFRALDPYSAYTGAEHTNALLKHFAQVRAGKALASGDTQGAADTLNSSGDLAGAQQVLTNHWTNAEQVQKLSAAEHARSAQFAQDVSSALWEHLQKHSGDPDGGKGAVTQAYDQLRPLFKQMGTTDQDLDTYGKLIANDPARTLTYLHQQATEHLGKHVIGDALVNDHGDVQYQGAPKEQYVNVKRPDQGEDVLHFGGGAPRVQGGQPVAAAPEVATAPAAPAGTPSGAQPVATQPPSAPAAAPLDPQQFYRDFIAKAEGGVNPHDLNGAVTNMGFNQAANPDIDVTKLTPEQAAQRFEAKYYNPSGAKDLPAPLAAAYSDTYFMNPTKAKEFLAAAHGDVGKFMDQREAWLGALAKSNPDAGHYAKAWSKRNTDLRAYAANAAGPQPATEAPAAAPAPANPNVVYSSPVNNTPDWETKIAKAGDPYFRPGTTYRTFVGPGKDKGKVEKLQDPLTPAQERGPAEKDVKYNASDMASVRELRKQSLETQNMAAQLDRFVKLNESVKTGGFNATPGIAQMKAALSPRGKEAQMLAIVNNITPAMRNGLPGAASDKDVEMFRGATVGFDKPLKANQGIAQAAKAFADRQGDYLAFLESQIKDTGSSLGADEKWKAYVDAHPLFSTDKAGDIIVNKKVPWRQAIPSGKATAPEAAPAGRHRVFNLEKGAFE